ncbi:MAG TPA: DinB family protein [Bryobacteraceae bacterium]|nr:DinB family protein [Bryobacteraceae bacterium]
MPPRNLDELARELDAISARAADLWTTAADPCKRDPDGGWSLAQCFSHLALSTDAYLPTWREALKATDAPRCADVRPLRLDLSGRVLAWFLEPPVRIRTRTKPQFEAPSSPNALDEFQRSQRDLSAIIDQSRDFAIDRIKIHSAFDSRVRYSIWSSLVVTLAHQRRHLWQSERVLQRTSSVATSKPGTSGYDASGAAPP